MSAKNLSFEEVVIKYREFLRTRNWGKNEPREFAISMSLEANELLEHFQWSDDPVGTAEELADELADIMMYAIQFANCYDIDIPRAIDAKMQKADMKYPAEDFQDATPENLRSAWRQAKKTPRKEGEFMNKNQTLVICSSAAFYKHVAELAEQLETIGFSSIVVPKTARIMRETGDYDVEHYKTWYKNDADYTKKADLVRAHFDEITAGDAILVVNDTKHGIENYIGPNVLMEMSLAWYQHKPIYMYNELPENSPFEEELKGMNPVIISGDITKISEK